MQIERNMAATRITAANVGTMVRQQVTISPHRCRPDLPSCVQVNGAAHDVFWNDEPGPHRRNRCE
jgi:hypothetical protein